MENMYQAVELITRLEKAELENILLLAGYTPTAKCSANDLAGLDIEEELRQIFCRYFKSKREMYAACAELEKLINKEVA